MALLVSKGGQTLVTVRTASQEISIFDGHERSRFQWIHLEKQKSKEELS